jgi:hypothetical protein
MVFSVMHRGSTAYCRSNVPAPLSRLQANNAAIIDTLPLPDLPFTLDELHTQPR